MKKRARWHVIFYESGNGKCPVRDFLESISKRERAKVVSWVQALEEHGINLHRPFADLLENGIHELRIKLTGDQYRILYFFCYRDYIVLTHEFIKVSEKVPKKEINKAEKMRKDFLNRYDLNKIRRMIENDEL